MTKFVVGLTGGIGSGKTSVSDGFAELGIVITDADVVSRVIVEPGKPAHQAIRERFGRTVLLDDGNIDRARLREIVFSNDEERKWLERQTHGPIVQQLQQIVETAASDYSILVLSAGAGRSPMINRMLLVDAPEEQQISRAVSRDNNSVEQIKAILRSQPTRQQRLDWADDVIVNDGPLENLQPKVENLHSSYLSLAANHG